MICWRGDWMSTKIACSSLIFLESIQRRRKIQTSESGSYLLRIPIRLQYFLLFAEQKTSVKGNGRCFIGLREIRKMKWYTQHFPQHLHLRCHSSFVRDSPTSFSICLMKIPLERSLQHTIEGSFFAPTVVYEKKKFSLMGLLYSGVK